MIVEAVIYDGEELTVIRNDKVKSVGQRVQMPNGWYGMVMAIHRYDLDSDGRFITNDSGDWDGEFNRWYKQEQRKEERNYA